MGADRGRDGGILPRCLGLLINEKEGMQEALSLRILSVPHTYGLTNPVSGGQNRFSHLVAELKRHGYEIVVLEPFSVIRTEDSQFARVYAFKDYKLFGKSLPILRDFNVTFFATLRRILRREELDLVEATHPSGMMALMLLIGREIPLVYSAHNVEAEFAAETYAEGHNSTWLERSFVPWYTALIERVVCKRVADHIIVCSARDRDELARRYGVNPAKITVVPSGGPLLEPTTSDARESAKRALNISPAKIVILFHGLHSLHPNAQAVDLITTFIAPALVNSNPEAQFLIAGAGMPEFADANVRSIGFVSDLRLALRAADIAIVPLVSGAGVKLKMLDYLAAGLPVVATEKGVQGIDARNREEALIVRSVDDEFIRSLVSLLEHRGERERIGSNARQLAKAKHDWGKIGDHLARLYDRLGKRSVTTTVLEETR